LDIAALGYSGPESVRTWHVGADCSKCGQQLQGRPDDKQAQMPEGSEFQTEGGSNAETAGSKGCVDPRDPQQIGVGGA